MNLVQTSAGNAFAQQVVAAGQAATAAAPPAAATDAPKDQEKKRDAAGLTAVDEQLGVDKTDAKSTHATAHSTGGCTRRFRDQARSR